MSAAQPKRVEMSENQMKSLLKVLLIHVANYPFATNGLPVPNDIVSLVSSKLTDNPDQGRLKFALPNFLVCLRATNHLGLYDFLFDSYFAVATLNDKNWKNDKPIEKNVHVMLKRVRDDVIKLMAFLAKNEAGLLAAILTANGGQMPNVNMTQATTTRGGYSNIDPFEMLGLKSHVRDFVLSEWKDRFLLQAKKNFENAGLMECMKQLYPPELYPQLY